MNVLNINRDNIIRVENLNLWYDQGKPIEVHALKNININIKKGDYVAFFGPSGCGKTSMLYAISGIDKYQGGDVYVNAKNLGGLSKDDIAYFRQTDIGIVFQQFNLLPSLTVMQNVCLPMSFRGISMKEAEKEALVLLERLKLTEYSSRYPFELSGGQQQRVAIARAIANDPPIILADEPLGNLDSVNAKNVLAFLKELNEKDGRTIIMVTHEAWSLQDVKNIVYMKDGEITGNTETENKDVSESISEHLHKEILKGGKGGLTKEEMSARIVSNFLLRGYSVEEIKRFEDFLNQRFSGKINKEEFLKNIYKPIKFGGVGLWKEKADRVLDYVENIIEHRNDIKSICKIIESNPEITIIEEVFKIRNWILRDYEGDKLNHAKIDVLDGVISDRLRGFITNDEFKEVLERKEGLYGAAFSTHTALIFSQKMEMLLSGNVEKIN